MRFMMLMIPKGYEKAAPGTMPDAKAVAAMMKYNESLQKAGVLLALDGLHPPSMGARVSFPGGKPKVTDGPFIETKEVLGGYWMIKVNSKEEAIEWASRCPGSENEVIELRQVQEMSDFPADVQKAAAGFPMPNVKPVPDGMHTVTPHLICAGAADAIEFYKKAFNAVEEGRLPGPQGRLMHAMVRIEGSAVMLVDEMPEWGAFGPKSLKGSPVTIHLYVEDVDAFVNRALGAGAKITMPLADMFWGDRYCKLEDPFGHHWSVATHIRDVNPEEMRQAMQKMGG